jgi:small subunit ribosomal protein S9
MEVINTIGRRKAAVARIYLKKGSGNIEINGKPLNVYFPMMPVQMKVTEPLTEINMLNEYDIKVNADGGGFKGQAEAIRMGIARALVQLSEDNKSPLKAKKMLTRDSRAVERKKYGRPKARKKFQFSKR